MKPKPRGRDRSWTARLESLRVFWYRRIVNFDQQSQADTIDAVRGATQSLSARLRAEMNMVSAAVRNWWQKPWDFHRFLQLVTAAFALVVFVWAVVQTWKGAWKQAGTPSATRRIDPVRREAGRWLSRFEEIAGRKDSEQSVQQSLQRLRYGPKPTWPDAKKTFRAARQVWKSADRGKKPR